MGKRICMIAYALFPYDTRIRRESETLAKYGNKIIFLGLTENDTPLMYKMNDVNVIELSIKKYKGKKKSHLFYRI